MPQGALPQGAMLQRALPQGALPQDSRLRRDELLHQPLCSGRPVLWPDRDSADDTRARRSGPSPGANPREEDLSVFNLTGCPLVSQVL